MDSYLISQCHLTAQIGPVTHPTTGKKEWPDDDNDDDDNNNDNE